MEARDTLRQLLAPPLRLSHLLQRGHSIALALRVERPDRPTQLSKIRRIFVKS